MLTSYLEDRLVHVRRGEGVPVGSDPNAICISKSHDSKLTDPVKDAGDALIVQVREPVTQIQSEAQRQHERNGAAFPINDTAFMDLWLARSAIYYRGFIKKWTTGRHRNRLIIDYDDLRTAPDKHVAAVLKLMRLKPDAERVALAVAANRSLRPFTMGQSEEERKAYVGRSGQGDGPVPIDQALDYANACLARPRDGRITQLVDVLEAMRAPQADFGDLEIRADALANPRIQRLLREARLAAGA